VIAPVKSALERGTYIRDQRALKQRHKRRSGDVTFTTAFGSNSQFFLLV